MKIPYGWLKELLSGMTASPEALAEKLTMLGLEIESITRSGGEGLDKVVVGTLLEVKKHPNADKLTLCRVRIGNEERQIVCGAKNHKAGDRVAVALPGAKLPNGAKIEKSKMRGEVSDGMLCSVKELGVGDDASGIWILPPETPEGKPLAEAVGLQETVLEVGVTPNRGDCLSLVGVAREAAAAFGTTVAVSVGKPVDGKDAAKRVKVEIEDPGCRLYVARVVEGVKIGPSPDWMARRLERAGIRAINNVVDVTNYVMLEQGQPLHAFDAREIKGARIVVRAARPGEKMKTLDGIERKLDSGDLVIADAERAVALAGVMGGEHSGIAPDTATVILESAWFEPARVRRVSRRHGLHSESSHRFERHVDPDGVERASVRAAGLIAELSGGKLVPGKVEAVAGAKEEARRIAFSPDRLRLLLGIEIAPDEVARLLRAIGFEVRSDRVTVPSWRPDVSGEVDLVEEVARLYGYERIPATAPQAVVDPGGATADFAREVKLRRLLAGQGFHEGVHLPFGPADDSSRLRLPPAPQVKLANPLAENEVFLRGSLLPAQLKNLARQRAARSLDVKLFELGTVFRPRPGELPLERRSLAGILSGRREPRHWGRPDDATVDFFDVRGAVEALALGFTGKAASFSAASEPFLVEGAAAKVELGGKSLGWVGEIHPRVLASFGVEDAGAFAFELDYEVLAALSGATAAFEALPRFPAVSRDVALLVDESVEVGGMIAFARTGYAKRGLESVEVFDLYRGDKLPAGKKSVALEMVYRLADRTLTDDEVNSLHEKLVGGLLERFRAQRRS